MSAEKNDTEDTSSKSSPSIYVKIQKLFNDSKLKAIASVTIGGAFAVHGLKVLDSDKGLFVSMPSSSYKSQGETKYQDMFHPITAESRQQLIDAVIKAYEQKLTEQPSKDEEPDMSQSM